MVNSAGEREGRRDSPVHVGHRQLHGDSLGEKALDLGPLPHDLGGARIFCGRHRSAVDAQGAPRHEAGAFHGQAEGSRRGLCGSEDDGVAHGEGLGDRVLRSGAVGLDNCDGVRSRREGPRRGGPGGALPSKVPDEGERRGSVPDGSEGDGGGVGGLDRRVSERRA